MSIETAADLEGLQRAGAVVADVLQELTAAVRPGITTAALDALADKVLERHGARSAPRLQYGFPGTMCISVNEEAVHGVPGNRVIREGDLVTLDVTIELDGYFADAAVTVVVPPASPLAIALRDCAEAAFWKAAAVARAGAPISVIGREVEREVRRRGFTVLRELCGHGIGRAIHEPPEVLNFYDPAAREPLTEGLVIALEPIVSAGSWRTRTRPDRWTITTADGSLAAHHEHTIVITRDQPLILTAA